MRRMELNGVLPMFVLRVTTSRSDDLSYDDDEVDVIDPAINMFDLLRIVESSSACTEKNLIPADFRRVAHLVGSNLSELCLLVCATFL